jgi:hypothetical protein
MTERRKFARDEVFAAIEEISRSLDAPIEVFLIGGLAMIIHGTKVATKDVDVVLSSHEMTKRFVSALRGLGFAEWRGPDPEYQALEASYILERDDGMRFDVFTGRVCRVVALTDGMMGRAVEHPLPGLLRLRVLMPEDLFILKSVTSREDDVDDMVALARMGLDWGMIAAEVRAQPDNWRWLAPFYDRLEGLEQERGVVSPLTAAFKDEAEMAAGIAVLLPHLERSSLSLSQGESLLGEEDDEFPRRLMERMVELGLVRERAMGRTDPTRYYELL